MLEIGSVIDGKYKILHKVGEGGMSVVYLAINEKANKQWAVKEVKRDAKQAFEIVKQSLVIETDMLKKLRHPNLPAIVDVIDYEDTFLVVMDYIEGNTLLHTLKTKGAQPQEMVIAWAVQLCNVLNYLHTRTPPIIYRDMKPANVMLTPDNNLVLIDFGIAREYKAGSKEDTVCLGTQGYAAPEQFGGHGQTDARTDVYCLGTTMYHLVTGHNPAKPPYEIYPIRHWNDRLSSGLEQIISKCTMKNPDERYQDCFELMYALEHYDALDHAYKKRERKRLRIFAASLMLTVIFACISIFGAVRADSVKRHTYAYYIEQAQTSANDADFEMHVKAAMCLDPFCAEAFDILLEHYLQDGYFLKSEAEEIARLVNENHAQMKSDDMGYADFSYRMGAAYWYAYSNDGVDYTCMVRQATQWFSQVEEVVQDGASNSAEYKNALIYTEIGTNKMKLQRGADQMGDTSVSYVEYWESLVKLYQSEFVNETTSLYIYKEIITNIFQYASEFKNAGIEKETITEMLVCISDEVGKRDTDAFDATKVDLVRYLEENIPNTYHAVTAAYTSLPPGKEEEVQS